MSVLGYTTRHRDFCPDQLRALKHFATTVSSLRDRPERCRHARRIRRFAEEITKNDDTRLTIALLDTIQDAFNRHDVDGILSSSPRTGSG